MAENLTDDEKMVLRQETEARREMWRGLQQLAGADSVADYLRGRVERGELPAALYRMACGEQCHWCQSHRWEVRESVRRPPFRICPRCASASADAEDPPT